MVSGKSMLSKRESQPYIGRSDAMRHSGYYILHLIGSLLVSAAIAGLYLFLFKTGYFPQIWATVWIAAAVSAVILGLHILRLPSERRPPGPGPGPGPGPHPGGPFLMGSVIGAIATIGFAMMAAGGFLSAAAKSTLVLVYFCAMFFAFELIQLAAYARHKLR